MSDVPPPPAPPPPPPPAMGPPPGYVGFDNAPTAYQQLRRVKGLSVAIVVLTVVAGISSLIGTALVPNAADRAQDFLDGLISEDDFTSGYGPSAAIQFVQGIATLAIGVLTIIWLYRMASNLRAFQRQTFWNPLWAIFGWFLPPMVLYVIPFLMLREVWKTSDRDGTESRELPWLWAWFVLFGIIPVVLAGFQFSALIGGGLGSGSTEDLAENLSDNATITMIAGVVTALAAVAWILTVRAVTTRHIRLTNER